MSDEAWETHKIYFDKLKRFGQESLSKFPFYSRPILPDEYKQELIDRFSLNTDQFLPYGMENKNPALYYTHLHFVLYAVYSFFKEEEKSLGNVYFPFDVTFKIEMANGLSVSSSTEHGLPICPLTIKARATKEQTPEEIQDHFFNTLVALAKEYIYSDAFKRIAESYSEVVGEK